MKNITKNLMSVTLGVALLAGSFGFCNTTEASPHNSIVHMDREEHQPLEPVNQSYYSQNHQELQGEQQLGAEYALQYNQGRLERVALVQPSQDNDGSEQTRTVTNDALIK